MSVCFIIELCLLASCLLLNCHELCSNLGPSASHVIRHVPQSPNSLRLRRSRLDTHLRFSCNLDASFKKLVSSGSLKLKYIDPALDFWFKRLSLKSPTNVKLSRACIGSNANGPSFPVCRQGCKNTTHCGPVAVPEKHLHMCYNSENITLPKPSFPDDANFRLYISAFNSESCSKSKMLGYAAHCQQEAKTDRPIAGFINFCPYAIRGEDEQQMEYFIRHELLHILGFSASLYAFFRDPNGHPLTPRNITSSDPNLGWFKKSRKIFQWSELVIKTVVRNWISSVGNFSKTAHLIVTPTVLQVAREYFGCPDLDGVELEDLNEAGVAFSHWEKRLFGNELMTATFTNSHLLTPITLALLEDSGWYTANYSLADNLAWGRNRGCVFATQSCFSFMADQTKKQRELTPFCNQLINNASTNLNVQCTPDHHSYGNCNAIKHNKPLPPIFTYFSDDSKSDININMSFFGGKLELANYCPFLQEITWTSSNNVPSRTSKCTHLLNSQIEYAKNYNLEIYGEEAMCLAISRDWSVTNLRTTFIPPISGAGCYKYHCSASHGGLVIELAGGIRLACPRPKMQMNITACLVEPQLTVSGGIICPDCRLFCKDKTCLSATIDEPTEIFISHNQTTIHLGACNLSSLRHQFSRLHFIVYILFFLYQRSAFD